MSDLLLEVLTWFHRLFQTRILTKLYICAVFYLVVPQGSKLGTLIFSFSVNLFGDTVSSPFSFLCTQIALIWFDSPDSLLLRLYFTKPNTNALFYVSMKTVLQKPVTKKNVICDSSSLENSQHEYILNNVS